MKAAEVMTTDVVTIGPEAPIQKVAQLMLRHRVSGLPVVDTGGKVLGIVTEGDLLRRAETGTERRRPRWLELFVTPGRLAEDYVRAHARNVREVMTQHVFSVGPDTPLAEVVALMESRRIKRLPVLAGERLVGIISRADLLRALEDLLPKTAAGVVSDAEIRRCVLAEIDKQPWAPRAGVDAIVEGGTVELCGAITDERERGALRVIAENVPGVKQVRDQLVWVEPLSGMVIDAPQDERQAREPARR